MNYTNPKRPRIYTACSDGIFRTYEYVDMQFNCIFQYKGHVDMVKTIKYVPEKNVLITGCRVSYFWAQKIRTPGLKFGTRMIIILLHI